MAGILVGCTVTLVEWGDASYAAGIHAFAFSSWNELVERYPHHFQLSTLHFALFPDSRLNVNVNVARRMVFLVFAAARFEFVLTRV